ncbi:hypothetical protein MNBD_NITROSPINAE04-1749 [hydrothermal vent metagenome]|uniref:Uncharacterized protein n=1 Tax=hydrothermal vent metagenome TaxID=652676 RepID=A0A3B1C0C6_9ZZZZ
MKCPQCNYVSFDYLDSCRKCSKDLTAHKSQVGIDFLEPIPIGVLAFLESGAREPVAIGTGSANFDSDDFKVAGDSTESAVSVEETATAVEDDLEVVVLPDDAAIDETAEIPDIPVEFEEKAEVDVVEEETFSLEIPDIEEESAADVEEVAAEALSEESIELNIEGVEEDIGVAEVAESAEEATVEGLTFNLDESLDEVAEEKAEVATDTVDEISLDTTISGIEIDDDELSATASSDEFSLDIGDDFDTETQLGITDLPSIDESAVPELTVAEPQENSDVVEEGAPIAASSDDIISIDTLDTDSELDVSLDGFDDDNEPGGADLSIDAEDLDLSIDGDQIDGLDLNLDTISEPGDAEEEIQLSLDDLDKSEEDPKNKTVFSDDDLDLQIGDDDIDFN